MNSVTMNWHFFFFIISYGPILWHDWRQLKRFNPHSHPLVALTGVTNEHQDSAP